MSHSLPPPYEEKPAKRFLEPCLIEHQKDVLVMGYITSPESGMDGSAHPALNAQGAGKQTVHKSHAFVDRLEDAEDEVDLANLYTDVALQQKAFKQAMESYVDAENKNKDSKYKLNLEKDSPMSPQECIEGVMDSISQAQKQYDGKAKGGWGLVRNTFRKLGSNDSTFKSWLELLPTESHYLSILCGGLKLILGAASRLSELNDEVVGALCRIPVCLDRSHRLLAINRTSKTLIKCSTALYVAILQALGHILEHYRESALARAGKVFFKQKNFEKELSGKLGIIDACAKAIDEEADICAKQIATNTNQGVKKAIRVAEGTYEAVGDLGDSVELGRQEAIVISQATQEKLVSMENSLTEIKALFKANPKLEELLRAKRVDKVRQERDYPESLPSTVKIPTHPTKKLLLNSLSFDPVQPRADVLANLSHVFELIDLEQDRLIWIMQSEEFQSFLGTVGPSILLINGQASEVGDLRTSLSFICAKLANALRDARKAKHEDRPKAANIICLSYFCGEHTSWRSDVMATPAGILNSFIAQLLSQHKHFSFNKLKHLDTLDYDSTDSLYTIFSKLVRQLPDDTVVFCILERLSEYDDAERRDDADRLLEGLIKLTEKRGSRGKQCIFKLLVTSPIELRLDATRMLHDDEKLYLPETLDKQGGFTALQWDVSAGQEIEGLSKLGIGD